MKKMITILVIWALMMASVLRIEYCCRVNNKISKMNEQEASTTIEEKPVEGNWIVWKGQLIAVYPYGDRP